MLCLKEVNSTKIFCSKNCFFLIAASEVWEGPGMKQKKVMKQRMLLTSNFPRKFLDSENLQNK